MRCLFISIIILLISSASAWSQQIDLSTVKIKETIDLREDQTASKWRMVVLMARDGEPGHAYVAALTFREDTNTFVTDGAFGLYPTENLSKWVLGKVSGDLFIEGNDQFPDIAAIVWTNPKQHQSILDLRDKYQKEGTYALLVKDCVSLVADTAKILGMKKPKLTFTPYEYIKELISKNG